MAATYETDTVSPPLHPGEVLREDFLIPLGLSAGMVARACPVPRIRIARIAAEQIGVSTDTALRLGRYFGTRAAFWLNLRRQFELETLSQTPGAEIDRIAPLGREAA